MDNGRNDAHYWEIERKIVFCEPPICYDRVIVAAICMLAAFTLACGSATGRGKNKADELPKVYYIREIPPENLGRIYDPVALDQACVDRVYASEDAGKSTSSNAWNPVTVSIRWNMPKHWDSVAGFMNWSS